MFDDRVYPNTMESAPSRTPVGPTSFDSFDILGQQQQLQNISNNLRTTSTTLGQQQQTQQQTWPWQAGQWIVVFVAKAAWVM